MKRTRRTNAPKPMPPDIANKAVDIIIVGAGGSGLATAVSAAEHGASVLVLEKQSEPGGTTAMAVGSFTAADTSLQKEAGVDDSVEAHAEDAGKFPPPDYEAQNNDALRRHFLEHASDTFEWLRDMGLDFHGPSPEPPNRAPRMHNVVPAARAYIYTLRQRLQQLGGELICDTPVTRIAKDNGRVTGVEATVNGRPKTFHAAKGVVLAAGDYAHAPDLIARFKGDRFANIEGINKNAGGDGHRLAEDAGARLINMDVTYGPELRFVPSDKKDILDVLPAGGLITKLAGALMPLAPKPIVNTIIKRRLVAWQHPEDALFTDGAMLVNQRGERFCNETQSPDRELALAEQPHGYGYILLDKRLIDRYSEWPHFVSTAPEIAYAYVDDYLRLRPDVACKAHTLEELAQKRDIDPAILKQTVEEFNKSEADAFGHEDKAAPLQAAPWVLLGPAKAYFTTTEGSPACTLDGQVLDVNGQPIEGLYAVGQNGLNGQVLFGHGLHIAWAITSGRLVGGRLANGVD